MNILRILEYKFGEYEWSLYGDGYEGLQWGSSNSVQKPSEAELQEIWDSGEVSDWIEEDEIKFKRQGEILSEWPIAEQFEALTEAAMDRPEKLNELINFIKLTKEKYPKL